MRAIGFAALSFGAVVALSATLGMSYRSSASPLDDPTASVTDSSSPVATDSSSPADSSSATADSSSPTATGGVPTPTDSEAATTPPTTDDPTTPAADDTPTDDPTPSDGFAPRFQVRASTVVDPPTSDGISFRGPNSATVDGFDVTLDGSTATGSVTYQAADPDGSTTGGVFSTQSDFTTDNTAEPYWSGACTDINSDVPPIDCTANFGNSQPSGLWALITSQKDDVIFPGEVGSSTSYIYIPPAPTAVYKEDDGGTDFSGTGLVGDTVSVRDSEGQVCSATVAMVGESYTGDWSCSIPGYDPSVSYSALQIDAGDPGADGAYYYVRIVPGGISLSTPVVASAPAMTYHYFPGGVTVQASPSAGYDSVFSEFYSWNPASEGAFSRLDFCPFDPTEAAEPSPTGPITCTFTAPGPGYYNPYSFQSVIGDSSSSSGYADDYFVVPVTPTITRATAANNGTVHVSGAGVATDGIRVIVDNATVTCGATTVAANGTWTCTTVALARGIHSLRAYDVDQGAGRNDAILRDDPLIVYQAGGLSALSSPASVRVTSSTVGATPNPTSTPTDFSGWFFTITGVDLNNVHPGDTFTVSGTDLPPGATVSGELHSKAVSIGSAVVQPDGTFTLPVTVPADFPAGAHTIVMTLTPPGSSAVPSQQPLKVVTTPDSSGAGDSQEPSDSPSPLGSSEGPGIDHHGPNSNILTHGLQSIADVVAHPAKIPAAIEIGLVLLIFAVLPGHLLNATLAEQYERFTKRREQRRRAPSRWAKFVAFLHRAPFVAGLALTTVTALLFGFADPRFGFSLASLRLFLGLAIALALVSYLTNAVVSRIMQGRWKVDVEVNLRPLGLILTVIGVVVSRLFDFSPGFLIGLVLGLVISEKRLVQYAWRAVLLRTSILLGLALLAWLAFSLFDAREEGGTFASELAIETLVAITTEAIVGLMVELLPLKLLEGEKLYEKSKVIWGSLYLLTVVIFVVAVVPWEGNWAELGSSLWTWIGIVVGFGIVATGVYLYFRIRGHEEHEEHVIRDEDDDKLVPIGSEDEG